MSNRTSQVEAAISRVLSEAMHDLNDPRVPLVVTVEAVRVTADLQQARVIVSAIGDVNQLVAALEHARGFLQHRVADELKLRRTPILAFAAAMPLPFEPGAQ